MFTLVVSNVFLLCAGDVRGISARNLQQYQHEGMESDGTTQEPPLPIDLVGGSGSEHLNNNVYSMSVDSVFFFLHSSEKYHDFRRLRTCGRELPHVTSIAAVREC